MARHPTLLNSPHSPSTSIERKKIDMQMHTLLRKPEASASVAQAADYAPACILEIELGELLPSLSAVDERTGYHYQHARCLIRLHTQPLGVMDLQFHESGLSADEYTAHIWHTLGEQINEHLQQDGLAPVSRLDAGGLPSPNTPVCIQEREQFLAHAPFVSIIVSTRDRPERLQRCLRSLLALHYPHYEIIIVDNASSTNATANLILHTYRDALRVRYMREDRPGLSRGRNCGMMAATGEILAFTDDDVVVDPYWLVELARAFSIADDVACATGLILPLELETPPQFWYEEYGGLSKGFARRIFEMKEHYPEMPLFPYTAGRLGTGASMSFRAAFLRSIGGFDSALGAGSPALGAEDLAAFFQVITQGYKLVYTPTALLYHPSYRDYVDLRKQIYGNAVGLTAYLTKSVLDSPGLVLDLITRVPYGLFFTLSTHSPKNSKRSRHYPKELIGVELKGMLYGPFAYIRGRRAPRDSRIGKHPILHKYEGM
jgi:GT2 family glycosyltransferase